MRRLYKFILNRRWKSSAHFLFPVKPWSVPCENEFLLLRPLHGHCWMKIFLWLLRCGQPGAQGREPKASPGQAAWSHLKFSERNCDQGHSAAAFSTFRSLLHPPVAETLFHGFAGCLGPMGNWQPPWERCLHLLPQTFKQQENPSVVCASHASWGQSQATDRSIYSKLPGLSTSEWNISILQSLSYSFSLLQGRILHWF